jgi:class 3 adenylate cyclase
MNATPDDTSADPDQITANLRRQLAEREAELAEARERQAAITEVLEVINSSPGDLAPVFDAMLQRATRLCGTAIGTFWSYNGAAFQVLASTTGDTGRTMRPSPGTALWRIAEGESVVQIADVKTEPAYQVDAVAQMRTRLAGTRTALAVTLRKDETLVGAITTGRPEVRLFSDKQIALLQNFAAQAVIAMENARLLDELRQRTDALEETLEYQTATSDVLKVISRTSFDLQAVLDTLLATAARLCGANRGLIATRDDDCFRPVATIAPSAATRAYLLGLSIKPGRGTIAGEALLERRAVHIADIAADPAYASAPAVVTPLEDRPRSLLAVPLLREGELTGIITLGRSRVEPFTDRQIELVRTFADQAVIAIENARLLDELRERTDQVAELNRGLEARVAEQVDELRRVGRLRRFLAPQLAELIVSQGNEKILESHRREIVVVFCDLRGYTAFTETAEPEEVLDFLREYHGTLGPLVAQFEGTLDQFSGDGIMVFFNDPVPIPDPAVRAVNMALAMREAAGTLIADWRERGRDLGFGVGIAQGYATLGQIGFSERAGYTAIGTVCNVAARLCAEAKDRQILLSQRVNAALRGSVVTEQVGALGLKGLAQPVVAYNVPLVASQPALRVIEGGPQSH